MKEQELKKSIEDILKFMGEDTEREGLLKTPERYLKLLKDFSANKEEFEFTTFSAEGADEMVLVKDISFFSLCEHHLAPFFGQAHVAYIPREKIVGLSKIPRTVDYFSRRPQNQERITKEVGEFLMKKLEPAGVAVSLKATHLCMAMRGVQKIGTITETTAFFGVFKHNPSAKSEFLSRI